MPGKAIWVVVGLTPTPIGGMLVVQPAKVPTCNPKKLTPPTFVSPEVKIHPLVITGVGVGGDGGSGAGVMLIGLG